MKPQRAAAEGSPFNFFSPLELDRVRAAKAERGLRDFVRYAWPIIHPNTLYVDNWHIDAVCEHLEAVSESQIQNLVINVPPRHSKSTVVAIFWPAWWWLHEPSFCWLFSSYSGSRAIDDSVACRRVIESDWYRRHWGDRFALTSDQNQKSRFENSMTGKRIAIGLLGAGTGEGGDAVVSDDPHNILDQYSPKKIEAAVKAWDQVMTSRVNDPKKARRVIVMQRISSKDLTQHVASLGYECLVIPTEYDPQRAKQTSIGWKDPRRTKGQLMNPGRFGPAEIADAKRKMGSHAYAAQHQQNPSDEEGTIFRRTCWQFYQEDPREMARQMDVVVQSWDFAFKGFDSSSKVAGHVWGRRGADKYLLFRVADHMDFQGSIAAVEAVTQAWPQAVAKIVEDKANGPAIINMLKQKIPGLIPHTPSGSKVSRAHAMQPEQVAGNWWLPDPQRHPWVEEVIGYCADFPNGEYDDDVDAMTQAWDYFFKLPGTEITRRFPLGVPGSGEEDAHEY